MNNPLLPLHFESLFLKPFPILKLKRQSPMFPYGICTALYIFKNIQIPNLFRLSLEPTRKN